MGLEPIELHDVQRAGRAVSRVLRPSTVDEALRHLRSHQGARLIAGGTDLLLDLQRSGPGEPVTLVDLSAVDGFRAIIDDEDSIILSGGVTHAQVVGDGLLRDAALPLAQACLEIGSPQLRNRATIAGNLATASPANDSISALMALGASVELTRLGSAYELMTRRVPVEDFFSGFRQTVCADDEIITALHVPKHPQARGIWVKLGLRRAQAISVVHAGMLISFEPDAVTIADARLAIGSVAATVVLVPAFAEALVGRKIVDEEIFNDAAAAVAAAIAPIDDVRATADYRRASIAPLVTRALTAIADGTHDSMWPASPPLLSSLRGRQPKPPASAITDEVAVQITVNDTQVKAKHAASATLLDWLRDQAGTSGVKEGCAEGECGACTVHLDGAAVMSCLVSAAQADGAKVTTIEGLGSDGQLHHLQQAFIDEFAAQCGFCIPGFVMAGARLLEEHPQPTDDQIKMAFSGNLCRCTGYYPIIEAVRSAARTLETG